MTVDLTEGCMPDGEAGVEELRRLFVDLTMALQDVLRVATSRGHRLSVLSTSVPEQHGNGPGLPAAAFG